MAKLSIYEYVQPHRLRFTTFTDGEMNAKLSTSTGDASPAPMRFWADQRYLEFAGSKLNGKSIP